MSNENVVTMFFSALQNLAFAIASSLSKKERADIADTFFALVDTFKQFSQKHSDVCEKLASAIIKDNSAADSLQKAIAMGFSFLLALFRHRNSVAGTETTCLTHGIVAGA